MPNLDLKNTNNTAMNKVLWIISFCVAIISVAVIALIFTSQNKPKGLIADKKIAGIALSLSLPDKTAIVRPPVKSSDAKDPNILAKSALLIDIDSGYRMYEKNIQEKIPIASTTKIMTAIVVLENHLDSLEDTVTITYPMIAVESSDIKLQVGEKISVNNLLKGLLIMSGNDTAYTLAGYFGGKEKFVEEMNTKARYLGLKNTAYKDPAGLDDEGLSTADDLAIVGTYAMRLEKFREIVKTTETTIASTDGRIIHDLKTSNHLLKTDDPYYYPNAYGIKTGFTYEAGHCLVSAATLNGHSILSVILNTNEDTIFASAKESRKLFDWGFNNWSWL